MYLQRLYDLPKGWQPAAEYQIERRFVIPDPVPFPIGCAQRHLLATRLSVIDGRFDGEIASIEIEKSGPGMVSEPYVAEWAGAAFDDSAARLKSDLVLAALTFLWEQGYAYAASSVPLSEYLLPQVDVECVFPDRVDLSAAERDLDVHNADLVIDVSKIPRQEEVIEIDVDGRIVEVRRPYALEKRAILDWVQGFGMGWASEMQAAMENVPPTAVIAAFQRGTFETPGEHFVGFTTFDSTKRGFGTAIAIAENYRGFYNIAPTMVYKLLDLMRRSGYRYPVFGGGGRSVRGLLLEFLPSMFTIPKSETGVFFRSVKS